MTPKISVLMALAALLLMTSTATGIEFYFNESSDEQSVTASNYTNKTIITFTPPAAANYTIIATAEVNHSSAGAGQYVGAALAVDNVVYQEILYRPKDITDWYPFSAVKLISLDTSQHKIAIQWNATSTGFIRNARIFVMQADAQYNESEGAATTSSTTPVEKAGLNFTPPSTGDYLIMASANIQNSANGRAAVVNLYINGTEHMKCIYEQRDSRNSYGCATIKKITLSANQTTINITFRVNNAADTATIRNAHLVAIRLDSFNKSYYNESESASTPAAANTWYNKTINAYTSTPGRHLILGSIEHQAAAANSNRIRFYNGTTAVNNISVEASDTSDWTTSMFMTISNLTAASQTDRIEHSAAGGTLSNFGVNRSRLISVLMENSTPVMLAVSASSSPIKGGNVITITGSSIDDPNGQTLNMYCSESSVTPNATNTACTGGATVDTGRPYGLTCTYATTADDTTHTPYCRAFDGDFYSYVTNTTFITDSTPPSTAVVSVAGDASPTYYDNTSNGQTEINISGESGMSCRYGTSDVPYSSMSNDCTISGTGGNCIATTTIEGLDAYNFYVSCKDSLDNEQNSTQNLDVTAFVTDWTAPTASDNSSTDVAAPPYPVKITESDNLFSAATIVTAYCTDTAGSCTPNTATDDGDVITFTSSNRGANYLRYNSSDPAGNTQPMQTKTININRLPAFTSASDNAATIKGGSAVAVNTLSSDSDSGQSLNLYVCNSTSSNSSGCGHTTYCSNTTTNANATCAFTAETDDATHAWYAFVYDSLNESATTNTSGSYITDSTPPSIAIISPDNTTYAQTSIYFAISTSEPAGWAGYSLNGAANATMVNSTTTYWSAAITASNGGYALMFYANDSYGNMNTANVSFSVDTALTDTIPPSITVWSPVNGTYYTATSILANITLDEDGTTAAYSINGTANATMGNTSMRVWNATPSLQDGEYNITFYANDTSPNRNSGKSGTAYFFVDTAKPISTQNGSTPALANDTDDITCHSQWTDNIGLDYAYLEHNETGTKVNSSMISLSGTSGWANYTIAASNTTPGIVVCKAYVFDKAGLSNATNWTVSIGDNTKPLLENMTYTPNTTDSIDPSTMISVFVNASDNIALSKVVLQYRLTNETSWNESVMFVDGLFYKGNFTPTAANYSFRIFANDTSNNQNTTSLANISAMQDYTWINFTTLPATKSIVQTQPRGISLGNITVNNTGDFDLNFTVTSDRAWIFFNRTESSLRFVVNSTNNITQLNVSANTTGFAVGSYDYSITINSYTLSPSFVSSQAINGTIVIQNVAGPYLAVTITAYDSSVTQGDSGALYSAKVENAGTADATNAWLAWSIPSGWSNTSGVLNRSVGFLGVGSTASNTINVSISASAFTGTQTVTATASSAELMTGSDSKSITVSPAGGTGGSQTPASSSGGIGGAIASETTTAEEKALLLQTEEIFELVRGLNDTFTIKAANPYKDTAIKNVTLSAKGFLAQYISITPDKIDSIGYNSTGLFKVTITAPSYLTRGNHPINFTITGRLVQAAKTRDIIEKRLVVLEVHEISKADSNAYIEKARKDYEEMLKAGFSAFAAKKLLDNAVESLASRDYETAKNLAEEASSAAKTAFSTYGLIEKARLDIRNAEQNGLRVDGTKNIINMALAAFEREDYTAAERRARDAQFTYAIETAGKINYLKVLAENWEIALASCVFAGITAVVLHRRLTVLMIGRKLEDLAKEEKNVSKLMKEAQINVFAKKKMSSRDYMDAMYKHEKRLEQIKESRAKLRAKRIGIITASAEFDNLLREDKDIIDAIRNAQRDYFTKRSMSKSTYNLRTESLKTRKAEIDEALAVLETKIEKAKMMSELEISLIKRLFFAAEKIKYRLPKQAKPAPNPRPGFARVETKEADAGLHHGTKQTDEKSALRMTGYLRELRRRTGKKLSECAEWTERKVAETKRKMVLNDVYRPKPRKYTLSLKPKRDVGLMIKKLIGKIKLKVA